MARATEAIAGADFEAIACIGTQVVSGRNYAFVCRVKPAVPEDSGNAQQQAAFALVYVYEDTAGNCEIMRTVDIMFNAGGESGSVG